MWIEYEKFKESFDGAGLVGSSSKDYVYTIMMVISLTILEVQLGMIKSGGESRATRRGPRKIA